MKRQIIDMVNEIENENILNIIYISIIAIKRATKL